jgi:2,3-bisphosphoglycerate-dependent phosphoglycerate mutase
MSRMLLVRHCESSGPWPEAPLTDRGRAQAGRLADFLTGCRIDAVVSSPYRRARDTIAPFAASSGLAVSIDPRLAERRMSEEPDADWKATLRRSFDDPDHRLPGAESARETVARGRAALDDLLTSPWRMPVAVTHGQLMGLVLHTFDSRFGFARWEEMSTPDVYLVVADGGPVRFERVWREAA